MGLDIVIETSVSSGEKDVRLLSKSKKAETKDPLLKVRLKAGKNSDKFSKGSGILSKGRNPLPDCFCSINLIDPFSGIAFKIRGCF